MKKGLGVYLQFVHSHMHIWSMSIDIQWPISGTAYAFSPCTHASSVFMVVLYFIAPSLPSCFGSAPCVRFIFSALENCRGIFTSQHVHVLFTASRSIAIIECASSVFCACSTESVKAMSKDCDIAGTPAFSFSV